MEERIVDATLNQIEALTSFAEDILNSLGVPLKIQFQVSVVIDEIFNNIASYAYPNKNGKVKFSIDLEKDTNTLKLVFSDSGIAYNPLTREDPDITLSADERKIGGLGVFMVKKLMDKVSYARDNENNVLTIEKKLNA